MAGAGADAQPGQQHVLLSVLHSAATFVAGLLAALSSGRRGDFRWFYVASVLSLLAGAVFGLRLTPAFFFNHNDLAHVLLMGAYVALHRQLRVAPAPTAQARRAH